MGRHNGEQANESGERRSMTDAGVPFSAMTPEQKAAEADSSHADPVAYATRNFGASTNPDVIDDARRGFGFDHRNRG
jgi:hypothetical protein